MQGSAIERVEAIVLDVPTIRPHVLSVATMQSQTVVLVRLYCADGVEGVGEGTTIGGLNYGGESPEGVKLAIDTYFAPLLIGADTTRPAMIMERLRRSIIDNRFAKNAVETALLDIQGKRLGVPVSELLGGRVHDRLPVLWTLASGDTARDIAEAEVMLASGRHTAFKLKIGKRPVQEDIAHVAAIKLALGDRASIRVDVNQAWSEAAAKRALPLLAEAGVDLIEQPIRAHATAGLARLTAMGLVPVMADEALQGPESGYALACSQSADVFALKIAQAGGLTACKRLADVARSAGVALYGGTMLEGPVGTIASAQLFSTLPEIEFGTELFGPLLLTEELLAEPLHYADGCLTVPNGPGLGLKLNEDAIAALRRDRSTRAPAAAPKLVAG
ncbi:muconate/chloromuconate family cycloisomerase [Brevundimonas diminuta]|uniref:muconate/chloromuconate family cycloisomerase n=1 Tax=Brevundimonas diminuta TaxID=293 RepID=UPI00320B8862